MSKTSDHLTLAKSITKNLDLSAKPETVFQFLSNPLNWTQFAIVNLKSVQPNKNDLYDIISRNGPGQLKMNCQREYGILDHVWTDQQASWQVYMRAFPNGSGCTLTTTFFQPDTLSQPVFEQSMREMDLEFSKLKQILEASS